MITYSRSKINLGLIIFGRRPDGYHELATVMVPIRWGDVLEAVETHDCVTRLKVTGRRVDCPTNKNLVMRAYRSIEEHMDGDIRPLHLYLNKVVPDGAGLGGGSGDAAAMLQLVNSIEHLGINSATLCELAATLGADCPFFIHNRPMLATGIGTDLQPIDIPQLNDVDILVVKPPMTVSTADAYRGLNAPALDAATVDYSSLTETLALPIEQWKGRLVNDFERSVFPLLPQLGVIKEQLYQLGALYASMSGSGSALYGLFPKGLVPSKLPEDWKGYTVWRSGNTTA